jgi:hypothetical protein
VLILNDKVKTTKQYVKIFADAGVEEPRMARPENFEIVSRGFLNKEGREAASYHFNASYLFYWRTGGEVEINVVYSSPAKTPVNPLQQAMTVPVEELTTVQEVEEMQRRLDSAVDDERLDGGEAYKRNRELAKRLRVLNAEIIQDERQVRANDDAESGNPAPHKKAFGK